MASRAAQKRVAQAKKPEKENGEDEQQICSSSSSSVSEGACAATPSVKEVGGAVADLKLSARSCTGKCVQNSKPSICLTDISLSSFFLSFLSPPNSSSPSFHLLPPSPSNFFSLPSLLHSLLSFSLPSLFLSLPLLFLGVLASHSASRDVHIEMLSVTFHGAEILTDARLELNCGRRYGLVGLNGSGV